MTLSNLKKIHNLIIIGTGPAGYTAAIYAARACLDPIMFSGPQEGGQLISTTDVENFPGFQKITGPELVSAMKKHALHFKVQIIQEVVTKVNFSHSPFIIETNQHIYHSLAVIISTGSQAKWLGIPEEDKFKNFGISACATCDGFFFREQDVMVVGGGNTAMEEALFLTNHAAKVTLVHRRDSLRGEQILQKRVLSHPKINIIWNSIIKNLHGDKNLQSVTLENVNNKSTQEKKVNGLFIAIGHTPVTDIFTTLKKDPYGYLITKQNSTETNISGVFAAGDVVDSKYRQAITAAGTGCMAALDASHFLNTITKP